MTSSEKQEISAGNNRNRNGQETQKTAFLAVQQIAPRGFEPLEANQQSAENKELTENANSVFATGLAKTLQKCPELEQIITAWPQLPEHVKREIVNLIQNT